MTSGNNNILKIMPELSSTSLQALRSIGTNDKPVVSAHSADLRVTSIVPEGEQDTNMIRMLSHRIRYQGVSSLHIKGKNNLVIIGDNTLLISCRLKIVGDNNLLYIGKGVRLNAKCALDGNNCVLALGNKTTVADAGIICQEDGSQITLGEDCMLSTDIVIRTSDSHSIMDMKTGKRINPPENVHIGNHVWIGKQVIINKGVSIGEHSVIGSGSVVTKDIDPHTIVGGNPARVLKTGITWTRDQQPLKN